jgi:dihydroorotase
MAELGLLREAGAVAFTDGGRAIGPARLMALALAYARGFDAKVIQHPQEPSLSQGGAATQGELATRLGLPAIPAAAEAIRVGRDIRLAEMTGGAVHFAHVSTGEALARIRQAKQAGIAVTCDTAPPYFDLNETAIGDFRTYAKLSPPLRSEEDRLALVAAVASGLIDVVMSDHNPQDVEVKRLPFAEAAAGAVGLQTMLPAALRLIHNGEMDFKTLIRAMSTRPAELLGLPGGSLRAGSPADLVVMDPDTPWVLDPADLKSPCKNTPFDEARFSGRVVRTIVGGRTVYEHV